MTTPKRAASIITSGGFKLGLRDREVSDAIDDLTKGEVRLCACGCGQSFRAVTAPWGGGGKNRIFYSFECRCRAARRRYKLRRSKAVSS